MSSDIKVIKFVLSTENGENGEIGLMNRASTRFPVKGYGQPTLDSDFRIFYDANYSPHLDDAEMNQWLCSLCIWAVACP